MVTLDKRLMVCAEMVGGSGIVCDVGTDHAYLPAYLIQTGKCSDVIASDINDGPLGFAQQTLNKYDISGVRLVKSDGLESIEPDGISDVVIAGMGGETICGIIEKCSWVSRDVAFILQPMTRAGHLRKWLYEHGFEITKERAVSKDRYIYTVIKAVYSGYRIKINETVRNIGKITAGSDDGRLYIRQQYEKLYKIGLGLVKAGKNEDSCRYMKIAGELENILEGQMVKVSEIYSYLNEIAPFKMQEKWDNSGLLVGNPDREVSRVLLSLDITNEVAFEAAVKRAELVISHHPVIFHPLRSLDKNTPVYKLVKNDIAAICTHTPFDISDCGMSSVIAELLGFKKSDGIIEITRDGEKLSGFGVFCDADKEYSAEELAQKLKNVLGCHTVRYVDGGKPVSRLGICTGSGGDLVAKALSGGAQGYITGDVKHDQWIEAKRIGISMFDCGHYHTEEPGIVYLQKALSANFPSVSFEIADSDKDPVSYV